MEKLCKGIMLMLVSAALACTGQLFWKLAARNGSLPMILLGGILYAFGAIVMIIALRYGEFSVLHPMMSVGYILSLVLGVTVLGEEISVLRVTGVAVIIVGLFFLSSSEVKSEK